MEQAAPVGTSVVWWLEKPTCDPNTAGQPWVQTPTEVTGSPIVFLSRKLSALLFSGTDWTVVVWYAKNKIKTTYSTVTPELVVTFKKQSPAFKGQYFVVPDVHFSNILGCIVQLPAFKGHSTLLLDRLPKTGVKMCYWGTFFLAEQLNIAICLP